LIKSSIITESISFFFELRGTNTAGDLWLQHRRTHSTGDFLPEQAAGNGSL
jgi:hypothetical protein